MTFPIFVKTCGAGGNVVTPAGGFFSGTSSTPSTPQVFLGSISSAQMRIVALNIPGGSTTTDQPWYNPTGIVNVANFDLLFHLAGHSGGTYTQTGATLDTWYNASTNPSITVSQPSALTLAVVDIDVSLRDALTLATLWTASYQLQVERT